MPVNHCIGVVLGNSYAIFSLEFVFRTWRHDPDIVQSPLILKQCIFAVFCPLVMREDLFSLAWEREWKPQTQVARNGSL